LSAAFFIDVHHKEHLFTKICRPKHAQNFGSNCKSIISSCKPRGRSERFTVKSKRLGSPSQVGQKSETDAWTPATTLLFYLCIDSRPVA